MSYSENGSAFSVALNGTALEIEGNSWLKDVSLIDKVLNPDDVITADGFVRDIITVNGQFPGPDLQVLAGADVSLPLNDL